MDYLRRKGAFRTASPATRRSVLLDIKMPRKDGSRCCARSAATPRSSACRS